MNRKKLLLIAAVCMMGTTLFSQFQIVNSTMRLVPLPGDTSDCSTCDNDYIICMGLEYTPAVTGLLENFTYGFLVECNGAEPSVASFGDYLFGGGNFFIFNDCPISGLQQLTSEGMYNVNITENVPLIIQQICFNVPFRDSVNIIKDVQVNIVSTVFGSEANYFDVSNFNDTDVGVDCTFPCVLLVELTNFQGYGLDGHNWLEWTTVSELNNRGFEILKSADATNLASIGWVDGFGHSMVNRHYTYDDHQYLSPISYYQQRQMDFNGELIISEIIKVDNETGVSIFRYTVDNDILFIDFSGSINSIHIVNTLGQQVFQSTQVSSSL